MTVPHSYADELPEHVRRIIDRDEQSSFTPPSFERWLGRMQMTRTLVSMAAFMVVVMAAHGAGADWAGAALRGIAAALVFHFFAWAACLFLFGEFYDHEVKVARQRLETRERDRARRIEAYYRERLKAQGLIPQESDASITGAAEVPLDAVMALHEVPTTPPSAMPSTAADTVQMRPAA